MTAPVVPEQFRLPQYNAIDAGWQRTFTIAWTSVLAGFVFLSIPRLFRAIRRRTAFKGVFGISESWGEPRYQALSSGIGTRQRKSQGVRTIEAFLNKLTSVLWWSLPGLELNAGQVLLTAGYIGTVVACIVKEAPLTTNSNRAGYIALAQLPVVFLFGTKNSVLSLILGPGNGYEQLNYIHKWAGRSIFIASVLHGVLWIQNHKKTDSPILGEEKETTGIAALGILCIMVLSSLRPIRRMFYEVFNVIHILAFVSFYVTICYHCSRYLKPWIYPPLAFYGLDLLLRTVRMRIKDAMLAPINNQMTLIHIPDCTDGWVAGQHVRLRVFSSGRVFESHPFSIFSAPPGLSCITSLPGGINLGARVMGDWTRALNEYARATVKDIQESCEKEKGALPAPMVPVQVMLEGPFGGSSIDLGRYETVLLFAGGAGATFTLGLLDDIVGRCVKLKRRDGEITKRIEFSWCVRSFGSLDWFAPALMDIAKVAEKSDLAVHISVYVTCLCNPEAIPPIPNCDVTINRPSIYNVLTNLVTPPQLQPRVLNVGGPAASDVTKRPSTATTGASSVEKDIETLETMSNLPWVGMGGGLAVCAGGPEGLTREASNAVARLQLHNVGKSFGPVGLHTEVFGL